MGARVQLSLGTAWEVSGNANHSEGKSNHQQVNEQSGLFAGDGGYHVTAKNVDLKGGAIASTNAKNSELITNKITFSDIQNESESSAVSASLSGKTGENENGQDITSVSPSLPMKNGNNDSSITKATLTEGKITLNKDTNPTQTTAKALGINTELTNANVQTETPNDVGEMLKEQSTINSAIGDVSSAVNTYTQSKQKEVAEKLKTAKTPQEVAEIKAEVESWGVGGSNKRAVDTVTTLLTTTLAGKSPTEVATAAASPYLNETIHKATEGNKTANLLAHAVLSAVEFKVAGLDPTAGALSGVAGEGTAMVLAEKVFNKPANQLTQKEKNILVAASTLAGTLAGATGGSVEGANAGGVSAKVAVENNFLTKENTKEFLSRLEGCNDDYECEKNVKRDMSKVFAENVRKLRACWNAGDKQCIAQIEQSIDTDKSNYDKFTRYDVPLDYYHQGSINSADTIDRFSGNVKDWGNASLTNDSVNGAINVATDIAGGLLIKAVSPLVKSVANKAFNNVGDVDGFVTQGVSEIDAVKYLSTPEGRQLLQSVKNADTSLTTNNAKLRAIGYIQSGKNVPKAVEVTEPLVKIVPTGGELSAYTPYFTTKSELEAALSSGKRLSDVFGLPVNSSSTRYGVFEITPKSNAATVFQSTVAPTIEKTSSGIMKTKGGGIQYIVPDRGQFNLPTFIKVIEEK
ncbi:VENN motif pre-toxin domain-containing protein [Pasteurella atlantica]|uniref:VENN motif pre-toxin domain-containing protein n=1 Tax=Pasteurellaceae TaxID=712 RepID=UPI002759D65D|nr:VENN motif pre-toxin domain-containing protein [Pasteurella atlantica]MDP8099882.1 VENN motif pre-toxin domain-containing protein [Pasteurella atlantica]MDP8107728.1 VENN motif pre-toxin domain-containing protein [Pasteurella atlantica]MDP8117503.1 VENN motif pre-toxin domain-containing protein [Pasteurella atlantica]